MEKEKEEEKEKGKEEEEERRTKVGGGRRIRGERRISSTVSISPFINL